jgi:hypothetical protein
LDPLGWERLEEPPAGEVDRIRHGDERVDYGTPTAVERVELEGQGMRRRLAIFSVIGATLAALAVGGIGVLSASAQAEKVDICHRTDSATNPYVAISVDISSVDGDTGNDQGQGDHFAEHKGPLASSEAVAQNLKDNGIEWGDIIPPVAGHQGLNWPAGQDILENDCNFVTPTPPTQPPVTTVAPPVTTAAPKAVTPPAAQAPSAVVARPVFTG